MTEEIKKEEEKIPTITCPNCAETTPAKDFIVLTNIGSHICPNCGVLFMTEAMFISLKKQLQSNIKPVEQSRIIQPSQLQPKPLIFKNLGADK